MRVVGVDWHLDVRSREKTFSGSVRIEVDDAPDPLPLDVERLAIHRATVDGRPVTPTADAVRHTLAFEGIGPGGHTLEIEYSGTADGEALTGMYVAPAGDAYVLTTMLFPSGSRRLLPAFEHPAIKTVYRLTLTADARDQVVFNTPPVSSRELGDRREWTFAPTPRMSAYLLYLGIGPFDRTVVNPGGRAVSVVASPGRAEAGRFAAERASDILAAYEEYYGIPYPLPKLDLIAIENFWAGAMENWGAIAGRPEYFLIDATTSLLQRRAGVATISHEIAHQWFGDLVTNAWWDDFWLNESFATFVGYRVVQRRFPEDEAEKAMLIRWVGPGLDMDALKSTHPIQVPVESPEQLGEHSDAVTYGKGAAILRMIESYVGEDAFRRGVARYLRRYQYSNARARDLWDALGEESSQPVAPIMESWILRPGYPVVRASWDAGRLTLRQQQFRQDGDHGPGVWPIPLRVRGAEGEQTLLFDAPEAHLALPSIRGLRLDPGRHAFARFLLDDPLFEQALEEFPELDPFDQWGVVSDAGALVFSLDVPFDRLTRLLDRAATISDELPVRAIVVLLSRLRLVGRGLPDVTAAARRFLDRQLERVGIDPRPGEPELTRVVREALVDSQVGLDSEFAGTLARRFRDYDSLPSELRSAAVVGFARAGGPDAFETILARLRATSSATERIRMIVGLGSLADAGALRRALDLVGTPALPSSEVYVLLLAAGRNDEAGRLPFDWFREHASQLTAMWSGTPLMSLFLHTRIAGLGLDREDGVRAYFAEHTPKDAVAGVQLGLEDLAIVMRLRRRLLGRASG